MDVTHDGRPLLRAVQYSAVQRIVLHSRYCVHVVDFTIRIDMWYHVGGTELKRNDLPWSVQKNDDS